MWGRSISPGDTEELIRAIYELDRQRSLDALLNSGDDDFSFSVSGLGRFRCSAYKQRSSLSAVLRIVSFSLPDADALHIPPAVLDLCGRQKRADPDHRGGRQRQIHHPRLYDRPDQSHARGASSRWRIRSNSSIPMTAASSASGKSPTIPRGMSRLCVPRCVRPRMSSSSVKCGISRPSDRHYGGGDRATRPVHPAHGRCR